MEADSIALNGIDKTLAKASDFENCSTTCTETDIRIHTIMNTCAHTAHVAEKSKQSASTVHYANHQSGAHV